MKNILCICILICTCMYADSLSVVKHLGQRAMAEMITDTLNNRIILFGGYDWGFSDSCYNDVWAFDLVTETWEALEPSGTPPSPRMDVALVYDAANQRMLLFGGRTLTSFHNDLWELDLTQGTETWTQLNPSGTPPSGRAALTGIIDPVYNRLILFGGMYGIGLRTNETWSLDLSTMSWYHLSPSGILPNARSGYAATYDETNHRLVVFSGSATPVVADLWALDLTYGSEQWQELYPAGGAPQSRGQAFYSYDREENAMVIGFGFDYQGYTEILSDVWSLNLDSLYWRCVIIPGLVHPRRHSSAAYNPLTENIVIFGGDNGGSTADTYILDTDATSIQELKLVGTSSKICLQLVSNPSRLPYKMAVRIPHTGQFNLTVHNVSGQYVRTLLQGEKIAGKFLITWDGLDDQGRNVPAGTYFITLLQDNETVTKKAVIVK